MSLYIDKLEENLKKKINLLESIFESDKKYLADTETDSFDMDLNENYLEEQNSFIEMMNELDTEHDEIYGYLRDHKAEAESVPTVQRTAINDLIRELEGKTQAVLEIENRARKRSDDIIKNRRNLISASRQKARVIQNNYGPASGMMAMDHSIFDTTN